MTSADPDLSAPAPTPARPPLRRRLAAFSPPLPHLLGIALGLYFLLAFVLYVFTPMGTAVGRLLVTVTGSATPSPDAPPPGLPHRPLVAGDSTAGDSGVSVTLRGALAPDSPLVASASGQPPQDDKLSSLISVLLLGYGGVGHDGAYLTDSMLLAVANPAEKTVVLLSLPRDIWARIPIGPGEWLDSKLNTAYVYGHFDTIYPNRPARYRGPHGGGNMSKDVAATVLGVPIQHYLAIDFAGFRKMIDEVGGVEVVVPESFTSLYPANDNAEVDPSWTTVSFAAGRQRLNGERALQFARARETIDNPSEGSDFARSRRQRLIIGAFKDRLLALNALPRLPALLNISRQHVVTDLALPDLAELQALLGDWSSVRITSISLSTQNYLRATSGPLGAYILTPASGDWTQVQAFARRLLLNPSLGEEIAATPIVIQNATGRPLAGQQWADRLIAAGYRVGPVLTSPVRPTSTIEDRAGGRTPLLVHALRQSLEAERLTVPVTTATPDPISPRLVLILGEDAI